ncbi:hypothetical protein FACS189447_02960 [Spirochaetia bacterium]|nr:hypothetical protein FACS189447_02960 [Spirochaetia bacterium]
MEAMRQQITNEANSELVSLSLGDSSVSLLLAGYWKGALEVNWGIALTPLGAEAISGDSPLLFTQEADLTLSLWIRERWFVEVSFMDDYDLNTYRAGYQGLEGEAIQYVGVGNTGLDFPSFPYLDLGGDSASSFGVYGRFGNRELTFHILARYDDASREEKIFVGNRERTYSYGDLTRPLRGTSFVLPDKNLDTIPVVYIQDSGGSLTDSQGRRWRLAETSEYSAGARYGLVELNLGTYTGGAEDPQAMIAVSYSAGGTNAPWAGSLGNYGTPVTRGPGFLGDVQEYFGDIQLANYPLPGETIISGIPALIIYEPGTFSPFEKQSRYRSASGASQNASVVRLSSGSHITEFELIPLADTASESLITQSDTRRGIFELVRGRNSGDGRDVKERWPLAEKFGTEAEAYPDLYLPGKRPFTGDIGLRFANYGSAGSYFIGNDAVPGSVQVFRGGIADSLFSYSSSDGMVILGNPAGYNEVIRITYLKRSGQTRLGSFAAGAGILWNPQGAFSSRLGLGLRWNITDDAYTSDSAASPGTVGLGAEGRWDYDRLKAHVSLGLGFEQPDTTGLYRAAGMEGHEIILSLPSENSFISELPSTSPPFPYSLHNRADLIYRNYRETSVIGTSSLSDISSGGSVISGRSGPYPAKDSYLSAQVLAAEFEFDTNHHWTGFETPLGLDSTVLEKAKTIEIPFRLYGFDVDPLTKVTVVFQAGSLAPKDSQYPENTNLLFEAELFPAPVSGSQPFVTLNLNDDDRRKLSGATYLRILIYRTDPTSGETITGRVLLAPPIVRGSGFRPIVMDNLKGIQSAPDTSTEGVALREGLDRNPRLEYKYGDIIRRLHSEAAGSQRVLELTWANLDQSPFPAGTGAGADTRLGAVPLYNYQALSFFVRKPKAKTDSDQIDLDKTALRFFLGRSSLSLNKYKDTAIDAVIPLSAFNAIAPDTWAKVTLRYRGDNKGIYIDGIHIQDTGASLTYNPSFYGMGQSSESASQGSSYMAFILMPDSDLPDGSMDFDEVILEDSAPSYRVNGGTSFNWTLPGTLASVGDKPIITDLSLSAALESGAQGDPFESGAPGYFGMNGRSQAEVSLLKTRVEGNFAYALNTGNYQDGNDFAWRAGHGLTRAWGPFSAHESFSDSPMDNSMDHELTVSLSNPFRSSFKTETSYEDDRLRRQWVAALGYRFSNLPLDISAEAQADWIEHTRDPEEGLSNYGTAWLESWEPMVPDWGQDANRRNSRGVFITDLGTLPLGFRLTLEGSTAFTLSTQSTQAVTLGRIDLPWTPEFNNQILRFNFRGEREFRRNLSYLGTDWRDDAYRYGESIEDFLPLWFSIPFYSLFNSDLGPALESANSGLAAGASLNTSQFNDRFEASLQLPQIYTVRSLIIPSGISIRIGRVLEQRLDTSLDTLNTGAQLRFSSINLFGALGASPIFKIYETDEFSHSIEAALAFPKGEKTSWRTQAGQNLNFYGFAGAELGLDNTFTLNSLSSTSDGIRLTDGLKLSWTSPVEKSLLGTIYAGFMGMVKTQSSWLTLMNIADTEYERLRIETLEFVFERETGNSDYTRYSIILGHESVVRIFGRLNLSAFARLNVSQDFSTDILSFLGTIGTSLTITF